MQNGDLHFGDQITVIGTFSEFLPFIDPKFILKEIKPVETVLHHTTRLKPIDDVHCGALFLPDKKDAFAKETMPIFYGIDSPMLEHSTGEILEMKCKIIQVPLMYRNLICENENFTFEKADNINVSFGMEILKVLPYGLVDSFKINAWLVGNLNPYPEFDAKEGCPNCANLFSFMQIDPLDFPPRYGCSSPDRYLDNSFTGMMREGTEEFMKIEKEGIPHVAFPVPFALFKVFCPNVDVFNNDQLEYSHNLLITAIKQNIPTMFESHLAYPDGLEIPESMNCTSDFQYNQYVKMTEQAFDPSKVPRWECPNYIYNPNWEKEIARLRKKKRKARKRST